MKKYYLLLIILFFATVGCQGDTNYILKNKDITVGIKGFPNNNVSVSKIYDNGTKVDFITDTDPNNNLWSFTCKPSGQLTAQEIKLNPTDAKSFIAETLISQGNIEINKPISKSRSYKPSKNRQPDTIKMIWKDVKTPDMSTGFDVTVFCSLSNNNSYWNIEISPNKDYGLWTVVFPNVTNIDTSKGNRVINPQYGGYFTDDYDMNVGFEYPGVDCTNQMTAITKGNTTLYISPEDVKAEHKIFNFKCPKPGIMNFYIEMLPDYMGIGNIEYKQSYNFNFATIKGDWFDAAKKFRSWGIGSGFAPFSQGKIEDREDLPQWFKDNPLWLSMHYLTDEHRDNIIRSKEFLGVPVAVHAYQWQQYPFDTHYPNWLPAFDRFKDDIKDIQAHDMRIMPYLNGHLVDANLSPTYKKYGDILLSVDEKGEPRTSVFQAEGAKNMTCCPASPYFDALVEESVNVMKEENIDGIYFDQVGCVPAFTCFNKEHGHPIGGGSHWADAYYKLIQTVRKKLNEIKGEPIIIATESSAEAYPFDAWLRCNEGADFLADSPVNTVIYSGYVASFGYYYYGDEYEKQDSLPAINKAAIALSKGFQPGWGFGNDNELVNYPNFGKYVKGVAQARWAGKEYFNLGEMVRNVTITSPVPTEKIFLHNFGILEDYDFPVVRTCSFNYKGKTLVCLTNIQINNSIKVDWEAKPNDLYLKKKSQYTISEIYPNKQEIGKGKIIKASVDLMPLETKVYIVE